MSFKKSLFAFLFLIPLVVYGNPKVSYIDSKGKERETDWQVYQTYVWKNVGKFKVLNNQTWIALPPLLELADVTTDSTIVENSKDNQSPFWENRNIKKVLVFEHSNATQIAPLVKTATASGSEKVGVKVQDLNYKTHTAITKECRQMGLALDAMDSKPYILSMDCIKNKDKVEILIGFSGKLKGFEALGGEILTSHAERNHVILTYKKDRSLAVRKDKARFVASLSVEAEDGKSMEKFSVVYKKPKLRRGKVIAVATESQDPSIDQNEKKGDYIESSNIMVGLLSSKLGVESMFNGQLHLGKSQFLNIQFSTPYSYFVKRYADRSYLDASITYNWRLSFLTVGSGLRFVSLRDDERRPFDYGVISGLNLRVSADSLFKIFKDIRYGTSLSYMPFAFDQILTAQRLRWEVAHISFFKNEKGRFSGLLYYDILQIKKSQFEFNDYKFVGGVTYQW